MNKQPIRKRIGQFLKKLHVLLSIIAVFAVIYDLGFPHDSARDLWLDIIYATTLSAASAITLGRYIKNPAPRKFKVFFFDVASLVFFILVLVNILGMNRIDYVQEHLRIEGLEISAMFLVFIREISDLKIDFKRTVLNPAQLFIVSFLVIIGLGALLLMLPRATNHGIHALDALFTSTSAVCVTGLVVVDTGSYFTGFGQTVILIFIQLGGLGIMTFASYFSYFFQGGSSYENQLVLRDMTNTEKLGEVFTTLKKIILITATIELIGAIFIFSSISSTLIESFADRVFFSIFHAISSFCNAGFSILPASMYESAYRFNYPMHLVLAGLYIIGGIGFPIVFNVMKYLKHLITKVSGKLLHQSRSMSRPWVINLNTRIVLITSFILTVISTVLFLVFEYNNTLAEHPFHGKLITAFFNATTTRTAGFNSVDMAAMHLSTMMIFLVMMWIGASPASTGGGIKTSTIAIATLNFLSLARGKDRIEIYRREIADISVRRAFAIISLSLVIIGIAVSILVNTESHLTLMQIVFECFSAYSTVGLSLGITAGLSVSGKLVLIVVMFIGRVSMLSLLIAIMRPERYKNYRYPTESILIN